jgi:hypothetical protein
VVRGACRQKRQQLAQFADLIVVAAMVACFGMIASTDKPIVHRRGHAPITWDEVF